MSARRKQHNRLLFILLALSLAFSLSPKSYQAGVRTFAIGILSPVLMPLAEGTDGVYALRQHLIAYWNAAGDHSRLQHRVRVLEEKLILSENRVALLERKLHNYQQLVHIFPQANMAHIPAEVISRDLSNVHKGLWINRGHHHGVETGNWVLLGQSLIGKVSQSQMRTSEVVLITDPAFKAGVIISGQNERPQGVLQGRGFDHPMIKYISVEADIRVGDPVVTSGFMGIFPKGLVVGHIDGILKNPNRIWAEVTVKPMTDLKAMESIMVVKPRIVSTE